MSFPLVVKSLGKENCSTRYCKGRRGQSRSEAARYITRATVVLRGVQEIDGQ